MLTTNQRMGMDQKRLRPQGRQMQQQAKDIQPQRAAQANPPQGVQQAPRVPATKGARTTPVFQAGKPMQAQPAQPQPSQVPSQQQAPQGLAPGAQGGQQGGGLSQQNNVGGIQFNPGGMATQPPPGAGAQPIAGAEFDWSTLNGTEGTWTLGDRGTSPYGGGGTFTPDVSQPGPSNEPPLVFDDRSYQQMLQDYMMEQLMNGGPDTAAQEALIMQAMEAQVGQGVADARANMGGGGFAVGGALGALEGDIRREGAMGANQQIMDMKGQEQDRWMDEIMGVTGALQSERELGIYETAFERALRMLEEDGGGGGGGDDGGGFGQNTEAGFQEGGLAGAYSGFQEDIINAGHTGMFGSPPDGTELTPSKPPPNSEIVGREPTGTPGFEWVIWKDPATGKTYATAKAVGST